MDIKNRNLQLLVLIVLIGVSLRIFNLDAASIRADEGGSIFLAERPIAEILTSVEYADAQSPFFYSLLHFWLYFGRSEFILRLLPVILSILSIPVIYKLGKTLFNDKVGLFAAFVLSISQANIRYAQNLRNYSLVTFFALLSIYFFYLYLNKPEKKNLIPFVATSALALYAHYYAGFILVAEFLYFILYHKKYHQDFLKIFLAFGIIIILIAPVAPFFLQQSVMKSGAEKALYEQDPLTKVSPISLNQNNIFLRIFLIYFHFSVGFLEFNPKSLLFVGIFLFSLIIFGGAILVALKHLFKQKREKFSFVLMLLFVPTLTLAFLWLSKIIPPFTYARYLLYISPIYYILIGAGVFALATEFDFLKNKLTENHIFLMFILLILLFNSASLYGYHKNNSEKENWRGFVLKINKESSGNEVVAILPASQSYNLNKYLNPNLEIYTVPENTKVRGTKFSQIYSSIKPVNSSNSCNVLKLLDRGAKGIWFVNANPTPTDNSNLIKECLESKLKLVDTLNSSYITSRGEEITDLIAYHFVESE